MANNNSSDYPAFLLDRDRGRERYRSDQNDFSHDHEHEIDADRAYHRDAYEQPPYPQRSIDAREFSGTLRQTPGGLLDTYGGNMGFASPTDVFPDHEAALLARAHRRESINPADLETARDWSPPPPLRTSSISGAGAGVISGSKRPAAGGDRGRRVSEGKKHRASSSHAEDVSPDGPYGPEKDDVDDGTDNAAAAASGKTGAKRAAQACLRCRRQKLRCLGGWPCNRCQKSKNVCDFGRPGASYGGTSRETGGSNMTAAANARLQQLESSVATLLAGLAGNNAAVTSSASASLQNLLSSGSGAGGGGGAVGTSAAGGGGGGGITGTLASFESGHDAHENSGYHDRRTSERTDKDDLSLRNFSFSSADGRPILPPPVPTFAAGSSSSWQTTLPPPLHVRALEQPRRAEDLPSLSPDSSQAPHVRFSTSPHVTFAGPPYTSPSNHGSSGISPASASVSTATGGGEKREKKLGKGQKAEERLAAVTEGGFDPPFKALVYQPAVWDNKEQSRRSSPQPSQEASSRDELSGNQYDRRFGKEKDDPVNTGLVDLQMAQTLFSFFVDHCHSFLPVVNVALPDPFPTIRQSPFLISAILAVSARFYIRHAARTLSVSPGIDPSLPARLANLAETHLGQSLLRKQHALSDVQAILIMAAWGLQSGGKGPDAWIVTGHGARVSRRLGVHRILARATETARKTEQGTQEWNQLEAFLPQWRTWLAWFCFDGLLSLGFGRPQSTQFETVDEYGFLQLRLSQPLPRPGSPLSTSLYGDVFIAGQVQLTQIGRDLINWGEMLSDPERAVLDDPRRAEMFGGKVKKGDLDRRTMFKDLNTRLDEWSKLWVWSGSPYTLYLGSSARIARLQAEHMRLCLNSYALGAKPDEDELVAQCLRKALNAAMSTIQTHSDSSREDLALSFATDYITITLAQAAVFLIRITKSPPPVQSVVNLDPSVVAHYLSMSVNVLETADLSETRLSTYLAKTIREIARAAGISGLSPSGSRRDGEAPADEEDEKPSLGAGYTGSGGIVSGGTTGIQPGLDSLPAGADEPFDLENFLQLESQIDLGYLLGLPGDGHVPGLGGGGFGGSGMNGASWMGGWNPGMAMGMGPGQGAGGSNMMPAGSNGVMGSGSATGSGAGFDAPSGGMSGAAAGLNGGGGGAGMTLGYGMDEFQFGVGLTGGMGLGWMGFSDAGENNAS